ncbi:carbohydrate kinase [Actibacterium sp. 188UL27-1]|uniref:carbohydrate kinase family protein n=1 Tax=Actibacterium sp. 188UL27-1 TaxID=2786961 RepID=UPI0019576329|nr:carbohydrate kinase [Actibacterium sp. 188UL27-1]MBM7066651.1 carbohydrate kinase [Actibacterium sp. 188UL27-1]
MILCAGEALIDMLPRKTEAGEATLMPAAGGAVFNTAIALGRLGVKTGFFSGISNDMFGRQLIETLDTSNVCTGLAHRSDRPTTMAFVELVDGQASYLFYDEATAGRMLSADDLPPDFAGIDALFLGGISLMAEPCGAAYETLQAWEAETKVTMLDPNIRPSFIVDEDAYRARIFRMIALADIVKLSDEDMHWLMGPGDVDDLARHILKAGPRVFCYTQGAQGVIAFTDTKRYQAPAPKTTVTDTVGAGDTFNAGFLAGLARQGALTKDIVGTTDLSSALDLGVRAAAVTVSRAGANPPWAHEM